jgi:hypothetical protein
MSPNGISPPNAPRLDRRAKYELNTVVRTILAADDEAFKCVYQMEDATGGFRTVSNGFGRF